MPNPTPGSSKTAGPVLLDRSTWPIDQLAAAQAGRLSREVGQASVRGNRTDQLPKSDIGGFRLFLHTAH